MIAAHHSMLSKRGEPEPAYWWLYFEAEEAGASVGMSKTGTPPSVSLECSTDGMNWTSYNADTGTSILLANAGDRVYFRAGAVGNTAFATNLAHYRQFVTGNKGISIGGNLMSIFDGESPDNATFGASFCALRLFNGNTAILSASTLVIPDATVGSSCFRETFASCTSLKSPPTLNPTVLSTNCYYAMFQGCTSLVSAPTLPADTLANSCYQSMFSGCSSLVSAPALPSITLNSNCYRDMFSGCSSLVSAPTLPALNSSTARHYFEMFSGCTSLERATVAIESASGTAAMQRMFVGCSSLKLIELTGMASWSTRMTDWVDGVAQNGTFKCLAALGTDATITRGTSNCPTGWTVVNL